MSKRVISPLHHWATALLLAMTTMSGAAHALTLPELQKLLQSAPTPTVSFREVRESPWLETPTELRGTLNSSPEALEKRVQTPRQETWRLLSDRMEWISADGSARKQILFSKAPALAALTHALRHIVAGDMLALERDFQLELSGDEAAWKIQAHPLNTQAARQLDHLEFEGKDARLKVIVVVERSGERTTMYLNP